MALMLARLRARPARRPRAAASRVRTASLAALCLALLGLSACSRRSVPLEDAPLPFRQAEDNFRLGNYEKAVRGYQVFLDSSASDEYEELVPRAYYRMAVSEYRRGRYPECLAVLDRMERRLPDGQWPQVYALRGDAELARGNPISALHWWEQGWRVATGSEKREARQHITAALDRMDPSALARARAVLTTDEMRSLVDLRLKGTTLSEPATPEARPTPTERTGESGGLDDGGGGPPARIGVLLPLSGQFAPYGRRSLNGIKLALGEQADGLVIRDTRGDPAAGRAAFDELAADSTIGVVIGPLRSKVAEAVAPRAEHARLPLVLLSQEGISGRWIVQPTMTADRQAATLAEYAIGQHLQRVGILYPNDAYGAALSQAFRDQLERRGGRVVGAITYDGRQTEFSVELLSVDKWIKDDGLQAVFIPDFAQTAIPLATQLRQAQPGIVLLGSNGWNDLSKLGSAADAIDGAVFVDGFFAGSQRGATQEFVSRYRSTYGSEPEILEAQAYDAARLVAAALKTGARTRDQVLAGLQSTRMLDGAAGLLTGSPTGLQRQLFVLRIANGMVSEISRPSPVSTSAAPPPVSVSGTANP